MIVKRLHPDVNTNLTEHEKDLWNKANLAHEKGDLETLESIWDELSGMDVPEEGFEETEEGRIKLRELLEKLKSRYKILMDEISRIKSGFPYKYKAFLGNSKAVEEARQGILDKIENIREADRKLAEYIEEIKKTLSKDLQV